jgi:hypothetical protein
MVRRLLNAFAACVVKDAVRVMIASDAIRARHLVELYTPQCASCSIRPSACVPGA